MVTIIAVIINHDVCINHTISFSVDTLITHIIKVHMISVFQHASSNPVRDISERKGLQSKFLLRFSDKNAIIN